MDACQWTIEEGGNSRRFSEMAIKSLEKILFFPLTERVGSIRISLYTIGGYSMKREKKDVLLRLRRIEGQLRGLQRMVEEGVPCADILTQVAAVTAAIKKVGMVVVKTYMEECLDKTKKESGVKREESLKDFQKAVARYIDWA